MALRHHSYLLLAADVCEAVACGSRGSSLRSTRPLGVRLPKFGRSQRHECRQSSRGLDRLFVLPYPDRDPSRFREEIVGFGVPTSGPLEFVPPPFGIRSGPSGVLWTSVPEAAIDEDGDPHLRKHDVSYPRQAGQRPLMDPISKASRVQRSPNGKFHGCVSCRLPPHPGSHRGGRRSWTPLSHRRLLFCFHGHTRPSL
jgi:hypothetical protein